MKNSAIKKGIKNSLILLIVYLLPSIGCGDDDGGGSSHQNPSNAFSMSGPMNLRPVAKRSKKKSSKPANINLFANEKLDIPPFNEDAQNIPPELFNEIEKEQRDPFRNFSRFVENSTVTDTTNIDGNNPQNSIVLFGQYSLAELKLTGIVWSAGREKALFSSPLGQPTIIQKDDRISKSHALVKIITHDKVLVELQAKQGVKGKIVEFSLIRTVGPYEIQYDKLRADQRGIRIRLNRRGSRLRRKR
jgi:Tfp pilus assembly protein PilP